MIKLHMSQLEKQPVSLSGDEPAEFLDLGPHASFEVASPMHYELRAQLMSGGILVTGSLSYRISGECGRCLKLVSPEIRVTDFAFEVERPNTEEVDISEEVREEALLVLPFNLLCSEDCKGLCACGADLNTEKCRCGKAKKKSLPKEDHTWDALNQLEL